MEPKSLAFDGRAHCLIGLRSRSPWIMQEMFLASDDDDGDRFDNMNEIEDGATEPTEEHDES